MSYQCRICGSTFECRHIEDFTDWGEEALWGHIQNDHPEVFEEVRDWETPFMLEECYDEEET